MVNKDEFNAFIEKMEISLGEILPPLTKLVEEIPSTEENSQDTIDY